MGVQKVTFENKVGVVPYGIRINQVQDLDMNEIKAVINNNADFIQDFATYTFLGAAKIGVAPTGTGKAYWITAEPGTYTDYGSVVVASGKIAFIIRNELGIFSVSQTGLDLSSYLKTVDIVDNLTTDSGIVPASARQVKFLNEKFTGYLTADFISIGKNIFNPYQFFTPNARTSSTGIEYNASFTSYMSDFIAVDSSLPYINNSATNIYVNEYNSNKVFIKNTLNFNSSTPLTTTATTKFIRLQIGSVVLSTLKLIQLEQSSTVTILEDFCYLLKHKSGAVIKSDSATSAMIAQIFSNIPNNSISPEKTSMFEIGKNLFNKNQLFTYNSQLNSVGSIITNAAWNDVSTVNLIPIESSSVYVGNSIYTVHVAEFDVNSVFIKKSDINGALTLTTTSATKFVRLAFGSASDVVGFQLEKSSIKTTFEAYYFRLKLSLLNGIVLKSELPDLSMITNKKVGKNIFNKEQSFSLNSRISSGVLQTNASFTSKVSEFIPIESSTIYATNYPFNLTPAFYDVNKAYISATALYLNVNATTPSTAKYMRIQLNMTETFLIQIEKSRYTFYEPYLLEVNESLNKERILEKIAGTQDISVPSTIYVTKNTEEKIFFKGIIRRPRLTDFYIKTSGAINRGLYSIINVNSNKTETLSTYDADYDLIKSQSLSIIASSLTTNNGPVKLHPIGDSLTDIFEMYNYVNSNCPAITFTGSMENKTNGLQHDGRSGWTLEQYFTTVRSPAEWAGYSPFLHPIDPYVYCGCTKFWIQVAIDGGSLFGSKLWTGRTIGSYDSVTGLKLSPNINDVMYHYSASVFKKWDGSVWVNITETELGFSFNYGKFLTTWGVTAPNIVTIMMGTNDYSRQSSWRSAVTTLNPKFITWLNTLSTSVHAVNPAIKLGIIIPPYRSQDDSVGGENTRAINAMMYEERDMIVKNFDNRVNEQLYVIDGGSGVDIDTAFTKNANGLVTDVTHCSTLGIGKRITAFIQAVR